jgi:hypothetical protein
MATLSPRFIDLDLFLMLQKCDIVMFVVVSKEGKRFRIGLCAFKMTKAVNM